MSGISRISPDEKYPELPRELLLPLICPPPDPHVVASREPRRPQAHMYAEFRAVTPKKGVV